MDNLMRILMLGVVMFALSSVPAPVDQTLERDGVSTERFELNSAPVTVDHTPGLGGAIAGLVLTPPVAAQNGGNGGGGNGGGSCDTGEECECWCLKDPRDPIERYGTWCERYDSGAPIETWQEEGPLQSCESNLLPVGTCQQKYGLEVTECEECEPGPFSDCDTGNGGSGNGGNGGGNGGSLAAVLVAPSGVAVLESPGPVVPHHGLVRSRCQGWVVGVLAASATPARLVL